MVLSEFLGLLSSYQATRRKEQDDDEMVAGQEEGVLENEPRLFEANCREEEEFTLPPIAADFCNFGSFPSSGGMPSQQQQQQPTSEKVGNKASGSATTKTNNKKRPATTTNTKITTPTRPSQRRRMDAARVTPVKSPKPSDNAADDKGQTSPGIITSPSLNCQAAAPVKPAALILPSPPPEPSSAKVAKGDDADELPSDVAMDNDENN